MKKTNTLFYSNCRNSHQLKWLGYFVVTFCVFIGLTFSTYAQSWNQTNDLDSIRYDHSAILLPSGKVLVIGGVNTFGYLSSALLFDPSTNNWSNSGSLTNARYLHTATLLHTGKVLVSGGYGSSGWLTACELYDPSTGTWSSTGSMTTGRYAHTATLLSSGKVLVTGGATNTSLNSCELYDPSTGTWSTTGSMTTARFYHTATKLSSGKVLVTGGDGGSGFLSSSQLYDPSTGTWSNVGSLAHARFLHTSTLLTSGNVLVTGGDGNGGRLSSCELYDPSTNSWSSTGSLANARYVHSATMLSSGNVLIAGGEDNYGFLNSCEIYNPTSGTWSYTGFMLTERSYHKATFLPSGKVLVTGGFGLFGPLSSCELYSAPCTNPTVPTLIASASSICGNQSSNLSITNGILNDATNWYWYSGSCGGTAVGSGTSLSVSPVTTTTYYVRGEGACNGSCGNITVNVTGPGVPSGANVYSGSATLSTQAQIDAFFNSVNGKKFTKVTGDLTINGNNAIDPITNLCNLNQLTEVSGYLLIQQFTNAANPSDLADLAKINKTGRLTVITCPQLLSVNLPELVEVGGSLNVRNNRFLKGLTMPKLNLVGGDLLMLVRNHRLETLKLSDQASSFTFSNSNGASVDIQTNGDSTTNILSMDLNKINSVGKNFTFSYNSNSGVSNFDNIFSALSNIGGNMVVTSNQYLNKCCIVYNTLVSGSTTISGNNGNCADWTAVSTDCSIIPKRHGTNSQKSNFNLFSQLVVYPSPNNGKFEIELTTSLAGNLNFVVTDLLGRNILTHSMEVTSSVAIPVNMDKSAEGQYILKLELNGTSVVKRFQVVK